MINFLTTAAVLLATASASTSASDVSANNDDNQRVHRPNVRAVRGVRGSSNTGGGGGGGVTTDETAFKSAIMDKAFDFLQQQKGHQHQPQQRTLQTDGGKGKKKGSSSSGKGKKKGGDDGGGDETCTIDVQILDCLAFPDGTNEPPVLCEEFSPASCVIDVFYSYAVRNTQVVSTAAELGALLETFEPSGPDQSLCPNTDIVRGFDSSIILQPGETTRLFTDTFVVNVCECPDFRFGAAVFASPTNVFVGGGGGKGKGGGGGKKGGGKKGKKGDDDSALVPSTSTCFDADVLTETVIEVGSLSPTSSASPTVEASVSPSGAPSAVPSTAPSAGPSEVPSTAPSAGPSEVPSMTPSMSSRPSGSAAPSPGPSVSSGPSASEEPSVAPTDVPSVQPSVAPTDVPSVQPSAAPTAAPTTGVPSAQPSVPTTCTPNVLIGGPTFGGIDLPSPFRAEVPGTDWVLTDSESCSTACSIVKNSVCSEAGLNSVNTAERFQFVLDLFDLPTTNPAAITGDYCPGDIVPASRFASLFPQEIIVGGSFGTFVDPKSSPAKCNTLLTSPAGASQICCCGGNCPVDNVSSAAPSMAPSTCVTDLMIPSGLFAPIQGGTTDWWLNGDDSCTTTCNSVAGPFTCNTISTGSINNAEQLVFVANLFNAGTLCPDKTAGVNPSNGNGPALVGQFNIGLFSSERVSAFNCDTKASDKASNKICCCGPDCPLSPGSCVPSELMVPTSGTPIQGGTTDWFLGVGGRAQSTRQSCDEICSLAGKTGSCNAGRTGEINTGERIAFVGNLFNVGQVCPGNTSGISSEFGVSPAIYSEFDIVKFDDNTVPFDCSTPNSDTAAQKICCCGSNCPLM